MCCYYDGIFYGSNFPGLFGRLGGSIRFRRCLCPWLGGNFPCFLCYYYYYCIFYFFLRFLVGLLRRGFWFYGACCLQYCFFVKNSFITIVNFNFNIIVIVRREECWIIVVWLGWRNSGRIGRIWLSWGCCSCFCIFGFGLLIVKGVFVSVLTIVVIAEGGGIVCIVVFGVVVFGRGFIIVIIIVNFIVVPGGWLI